jgi:protein-L-isoaspartate(D-aspartate) O-methyltransferase
MMTLFRALAGLVERRNSGRRPASKRCLLLPIVFMGLRHYNQRHRSGAPPAAEFLGRSVMDYVAARYNMVESQIRTNKVDDPRVTQALCEVPREMFLPKPMRSFAYVDEDIAVAPGRYMVEPLVLARLLQGAAILPSDLVLMIGDASGYATAVASKLASSVVALESDPDLAARAGVALSDLGIDSAAVVQGALAQGYPAQSPYDAIVFAGGVDEIPTAICRQLADGGRLVAVVDSGNGGRGTLVVRVGDTYGRRALFEAATPLLPGFGPKSRFVF